MRGGPGFLLGAAAATASTQSFHCGPNPHEVGQIVLMVTPAVYVLGVGIVALLLSLWRHHAPVWPPRFSVLAALGALHCVAGALAWPSPMPLNDAGRPRIDAGLLLLALWLYGTSYATVMLVTLRLAIRVAPHRAYLFAHLPQLLCFGLPAALLASDRLQNTWLWGADGDHAERFFTSPGLAGWIPGPIFVFLLAEILIRRRRRAPA